MFTACGCTKLSILWVTETNILVFFQLTTSALKYISHTSCFAIVMKMPVVIHWKCSSFEWVRRNLCNSAMSWNYYETERSNLFCESCLLQRVRLLKMPRDTSKNCFWSWVSFSLKGMFHNSLLWNARRSNFFHHHVSLSTFKPSLVLGSCVQKFWWRSRTSSVLIYVRIRIIDIYVILSNLRSFDQCKDSIITCTQSCND